MRLRNLMSVPVQGMGCETQTSIVSFLETNVSADTIPNQSCEPKARCPTCYLDFPIHDIESHADACADQFDPVGIAHIDLQSEMLNEQDESVMEKSPVSTTIDDDGSCIPLEKIKQIILGLHQHVDTEKVNRISIRRKYAYEDYVDARERLIRRKKFNQNSKLKLTFIGEPAVDDGGPRREFFSGTVYCLCLLSTAVICWG
jgi:hypothetical protein